MNRELPQNSKRLTRAWGWRWMRGMEASWEHIGQRGATGGGGSLCPRRARVEELGGNSNDWNRMIVCVSAIPPGAVPVLGDPATDGCVEYIARELWVSERISVQFSHGRWYAHAPTRMGMGHALPTQPYATRGEAWAALVIAAPLPNSNSFQNGNT